MNISTYRVVLIEDDPMVQEVNRQFIERVERFQMVGMASNGKDGLKMIAELKPDLVILDLFMPMLDGKETLLKLRKEKIAVDVILITAAKDTGTIHDMLRLGAFDYLIKPFKFERFKQALDGYRAFRSQIDRKGGELSQAGLDLLMHGEGDKSEEAKEREDCGKVGQGEKRGDGQDVWLPETELPKGLNAVTLKQVMHCLAQSQESLSAEEVSDGIGIARVTARRYLDFLEKEGKLSLSIRYGGVGRPINRYLLNRQG